MSDFRCNSLDSAIYAQLYSFTTVSEWRLKSANEQVTSAEDDKDRVVHLPVYSLSALHRLCQTLDVPTIRTMQNAIGPSMKTIIGSGGFGQVSYETVAALPARGQAVAVKSFTPLSNVQNPPKISINSTAVTISQAYVEVCVMKHPDLIACPNITKLTGLYLLNRHSENENALEFGLVTEYADMGSLETCLARQVWDWGIRKQILFDIAAGLAALHDCDIIHNDVKCANVLIFSESASERVTAKLADFGCSVPLAATKGYQRSAGTRLYAPPEAYADNSVVAPSRDVYSFGLMIINVATGSAPFSRMTMEDVWELKNDEETMRKYVHKCLQPDTPKFIGDAAMRAIARASDRPTMHEIFRDPSLAYQREQKSSNNSAWLGNMMSNNCSSTVGTLFQKVRLLIFQN